MLKGPVYDGDMQLYNDFTLANLGGLQIEGLQESGFADHRCGFGTTS